MSGPCLKGLAELVRSALCCQRQSWHHFTQHLRMLRSFQDLQRALMVEKRLHVTESACTCSCSVDFCRSFNVQTAEKQLNFSEPSTNSRRVSGPQSQPGDVNLVQTQMGFQSVFRAMSALFHPCFIPFFYVTS